MCLATMFCEVAERFESERGHLFSRMGRASSEKRAKRSFTRPEALCAEAGSRNFSAEKYA